MTISAGLNAAILKALKIATPTLSRRAKRLAQQYGPMSGDEARWIIAHDAGIDLRKYGLSQAQLDRVRELRPRVEVTEPQLGRDRRHGAAKSVRVTTAARELAPTPSAIFNVRGYHQAVVRSSRRLFVGGHPTEAIHRAFQSVNNRVKRLSGIADDGQALMGKAFSEKTSIFFKATRIYRIPDVKRNAIIYLAVSSKIIEGSPANAISVVPVMPWPGK